jgi:glycosyltransferase involved in cell wall biosynthesis
MVVVPNFVDPDPGPGEHDGDYALFVGRLTPEKGIATLLRSWQSVGQQVPLRIVGNGPMAKHVADTASATAGIDWLGEQTPEQVQRLMGSAKLLVVPSEWYETFGLVVVEAFARGIPVVASDIGALGELVDDGETGLLFDPGNSDALAERVRWLAERPSDRKRMGAAARQKFETTYSAQQAEPALLAAYELALASKGVS